MSSSTSAVALPKLRTLYKDTLIAQLQKSMGVGRMQVPKLNKITINMGAGDAAQDKKIAKLIQDLLTSIAGQHAVVTLARKSVAGFKIREGWPIGAKVTLRGNKMYEFLEKFLSVALPTTRDFRGLSTKSFDGQGNYTIGIKENIIFPEVDFDKVDKIRGLDITFSTSAKNDVDGRALLDAFKFPFKDAVKFDEGRS